MLTARNADRACVTKEDSGPAIAWNLTFCSARTFAQTISVSSGTASNAGLIGRCCVMIVNSDPQELCETGKSWCHYSAAGLGAKCREA
jgi:hypothetical protein